jgi:hypothetical protein
MEVLWAEQGLGVSWTLARTMSYVDAATDERG